MYLWGLILERDELGDITKFLRKLCKRGKDEGVSVNAIRYLEIVICRLYNAKLDSEKIRHTLYESKKTIISEFPLSNEEEEYVEALDVDIL